MKMWAWHTDEDGICTASENATPSPSEDEQNDYAHSWIEKGAAECSAGDWGAGAIAQEAFARLASPERCGVVRIGGRQEATLVVEIAAWPKRQWRYISFYAHSDGEVSVHDVSASEEEMCERHVVLQSVQDASVWLAGLR